MSSGHLQCRKLILFLVVVTLPEGSRSQNIFCCWFIKVKLAFWAALQLLLLHFLLLLSSLVFTLTHQNFCPVSVRFLCLCCPLLLTPKDATTLSSKSMQLIGSWKPLEATRHVEHVQDKIKSACSCTSYTTCRKYRNTCRRPNVLSLMLSGDENFNLINYRIFN